MVPERRSPMSTIRLASAVMMFLDRPRAFTIPPSIPTASAMSPGITIITVD